MWHRVEATADSLSINISLMASSWADLAADAIRQRLRAHEAARYAHGNNSSGCVLISVTG